MRPKLVRSREPGYFLRPDGASAEIGPLSLEKLREMAEAGEIVQATLFRLEDETGYRRLGEDPPLAADLWPDEEPFDPEREVVVSEAGMEEADEVGSAETAELLRENVERERALREAAGEPEGGVDWSGLKSSKWVLVRWVFGLIFLGVGIFSWATGDETSTSLAVSFIIGLGSLILGLLLVSPEVVRVVMAPIGSFFEAMLQGTGGGGGADFWTADSLMAQGDYLMALTEYRRIVREHPRELEAYLKGIRAARALQNEAEATRLHDLALKNLKSEQDRNLFLSSLERMG